MMKRDKIVKVLIAVVASLVCALLPAGVFGIDGLTVIQQRVIALFVFAALMWILEPVPIWTTSVGLMVLLLLTTSDSMFVGLKDVEAENFGNIVSYKGLMASFADPVIMLFMGGFCLAMAATKTGLDRNLARVLLKPFGTRSHNVVLGFMIITAFLSMLMSNTATTAMMLAIIAPVLRLMPEGSTDRTALVMAIPVASDLGGVGTPIGTPPNAIAVGYLRNNLEFGVDISFGQWTFVMAPFVLVFLLISWLILIRLFPLHQKHVSIAIEGKFRTDREAVIVYVTAAVTTLLWMTDRFTGINSNTVALIPLAVFAMTGVIGVKELKSLNWDILWLVAGGFALGVGLNQSGLAKALVASIPFGTWSPLIVLAGSGLICFAMSTFMSNSGTAALLIPILSAVALGMKDVLEPWGGPQTLLIGVAICASMAQSLPISTPSTAMAYATGYITQRQMATSGMTIGVLGMILGYAWLIGAIRLGLF